MTDNIMINGLYEDMKRKAEKRVEWRMLSLQRPAFGQNTMIDWLCLPSITNILKLETFSVLII